MHIADALFLNRFIGMKRNENQKRRRNVGLYEYFFLQTTIHSVRLHGF